MNKKQIDSTAIENELKGASHFFPTTEQAESGAKPKKILLSPKTIEEDQTHKETNTKNSQQPVDANTTVPSNHPTTVSRHHGVMTPSNHDTTTPAQVDAIRKAVKLVGKEAATHRFTPEEKQAIAEIIYTYRRQGYDTSENEIARIAINWLVWDHRENGQESVLAQVLTALKE